MNELAAFAKTYGVWVDIVCHPRKKQVGEKVNAMDIKGSSLIANNADNIASIIKNPAKEKIRLEGELTPAQDREMHDAEIRVDKQREVGWNGLFKLWYNQRTGNFSTSPPPEVVRQ
jgi:twinkle protein